MRSVGASLMMYAVVETPLPGGRFPGNREFSGVYRDITVVSLPRQRNSAPPALLLRSLVAGSDWSGTREDDNHLRALGW